MRMQRLDWTGLDWTGVMYESRQGEETMISEEYRLFFESLQQKYYKCQTMRIYLFGSRARGDNKERADYDFACDIPKRNQSSFLLEFTEEAPTLCGVDVVVLEEAIRKEGKLVYES